MSKTSRKNRQRRSREELEQRRARQNRIITLIAALGMTALILAFVWQFAGDEEAPDTTAGDGGAAAAPQSDAVAGDTGASACVSDDAGGTRPLAAIDPVNRNGYFDSFPETVIDTANDYEAIITVQGKGEMRLQLFDDQAPMTVNNFVYLARQGFYDCVPFHRVLEDFMAQGGDPSGTGTGGPGYQFADETDNGLGFDRPGLLAMANAGPGTNGSQFFITFAPTPWLDGNHTIFGELVEGEDVLNSLTRVDPQRPSQLEPDVIQRIEIVES